MPSRSMRWVAMTGVSTATLTIGVMFRPVVIVGRCMEPALKNRDVVWMDCRYYRSHTVRRGDIVVFRHRNEILVKRVHAVAGDVIRVAHFRNGDSWLFSDLVRMPQGRRALCRPLIGSVSELRIPPGSVYVVGDNRNASLDSRDFGPVPVSSVLGRVRAPSAPPDRTAELERQMARAWAPVH